uniref:Uncharacterized protein n=1 Tax=Cucumis melo TaxID=3656 RepID=A0A9I9EAP5_CUCME
MDNTIFVSLKQFGSKGLIFDNGGHEGQLNTKDGVICSAMVTCSDSPSTKPFLRPNPRFFLFSLLLTVQRRRSLRLLPLLFAFLHRQVIKVLDGLKYASSHEWVKHEGSVATVGITLCVSPCAYIRTFCLPVTATAVGVLLLVKIPEGENGTIGYRPINLI